MGEGEQAFELVLASFYRDSLQLLGLAAQSYPAREHGSEEDDEQYGGKAEQTGDPVHRVMDTQKGEAWVNSL
jgi:hypothetical protein